jgi:molybdopterin molybdotransferase
MLAPMGLDTLDMGVVPDVPEALERAFATAAASADVVITSGGVSVGEADYVKTLLDKLGEVVFWKIAMKPGRPLAYGRIGNAHFFGLPGNPVSVMVTFELFVRPTMRRLLGHRLPYRRTVPVRVAEPITLGPKLRHFLRVVVQGDGPREGGKGGEGGGTLSARLTGPPGSGILTSMARANGLLIVPEDRPAVAAGETLAALLLDDPHHVAEVPF